MPEHAMIFKQARSGVMGTTMGGAILAAVLGLAMPAVAQPAEAGDAADAPGIPGDGSYDALVARLNSPSATEREQALLVLSSEPAYDLKRIESTLRTETLTAEQRYRLMEAARERFMGSTRAAMGVQFSRLPIPERVVLEKTYPQFPSFKVLKEGDMIIEVEGEKLRSRDAWTRLGSHIVSKDPGDTLSVIVRRGEEKLALEVELGSYRDLPGPSSMDIAKMERAWELRSAAYQPVTGKEPIAIGLPAGKWDAGVDQAADQKRVRVKMQLPTLYRPRLIAGGEARGGEVDQDEIWNAFNNGRVNAIDQRAIRNLAQAQQMMQQEFGSQVTMTIQQEISGLELSREQIKTAMARTGAVGNKPANQGLAEWELGNMDRVKMLTLIEQSITALKAEAAEMTSPDVPTGNPVAEP